jgi:hypothetical protein
MPPPVILGHVPQRSVDTSLSGDGVRTSREELGDTGGLETGFGETEGGTETGSTSAAVRWHRRKRLVGREKRRKGREKKNRETHTTIASYSCSMRGYLPEIVVCRRNEEGQKALRHRAEMLLTAKLRRKSRHR